MSQLQDPAPEGLSSDDFARQFGFSAGYVEKVYADWRAAPESVSEEWRRFFLERSGATAQSAPPASAGAPSVAAPARAPAPDAPATPAREPAADDSGDGSLELIRGVAARIATNMEASLEVPTATSAREVPVVVLEENRRIINEHLAIDRRGKASFTHLVAWAMVRALEQRPAMATSYVLFDGRPHRRSWPVINLGVAADTEGRDGRRSLVVPNLKDVARHDFAEFLAAFNDVIGRARRGKLTPEDFQDTTCTLTNPGMIGTVSSLPRLMAGQAFILATGSIGVPAAYMGASVETLNELGISKVMTVTNTYDHRVIQGAESGDYLALMHQLLVGEHDFYERIFADLGIPHRPYRFTQDRRAAPGSPLREIENMERAAKVMQYIRAYRVRGYLLADLDPLHYEPKTFPELDMSSYGLTIWDLGREFFTGGVTGRPIATLREIRATLHATYCRRIGAEFMHIADPEQKEWLRTRMEGNHNREELPRETVLRVLDKLVEAEAFERFLHTRFVGHKRFSLEGAETLIPALDALLLRAIELGVHRAVMGMAHRGRLNVLAHVLGKPLTRIFSEFEGSLDPALSQGSGDVKYHLGTTGSYRSPDGGALDIELASNPSHLEAVSPVVEGVARGRQLLDDESRDRQGVLPILIHGDAAFAGQGVVSETLNMSQLPGYRTGGTVHIIVNNQIGYTTLPADARSTPYCTDVAKAIQAPIFHVNGDDPLAVVRMVRLALDYRQQFGRDVVVDIVCYRRHGHNEGDEPEYTQPVLYRRIQAHATVREIYQAYLLRAGVLDGDDVRGFDEALDERLRAALDEVRSADPPRPRQPRDPAPPQWAPRSTGVDLDRLQALAEPLFAIPDGFSPHPKLLRLWDRRRQMLAGERGVDFGCGESLAFATLLTQGVPVRLAGQDSGRGTFSQRHAVIVDTETADRHVPLRSLADEQARFLVVDSLLSEEAALGFEYGFAVARPDVLTLWEAQFGDFANGAQIQIDQFLAAGESKWGQQCGLVLLLPHGYDGQGPEHSSARLERFLQLCADGNMRVANPSTPAQMFHLLRKQALDEEKKPLVVMTPKSTLRLPAASSPIEAFAEGDFHTVLADPTADPDQVDRVLLCSGKLYFELVERRQEASVEGVALVRVEQLYPWPAVDLDAVLATYPRSRETVWCQEEPANMGAWPHVAVHTDELGYVGREASASPATGSLHRHKAGQAELIDRALGLARAE